METTEKVPKLRFKSFNDNYFKNKLGDVISIFRGSSPRPKGDPLYYGGNIPRLMIRDATRDGKFTTPVIDYLTKEGAKKSRYLKKGSVVLSCSGTVVAIPTILAVDACIHDGWFGFSKLEKIDTEYLYYFFLRFHSRLQGSATTGGVFNNLTVDIMKSVAFSYPKLLEQQKIASFLSSVDEKISKLEKKKTLLETYKSGIMQKIFSQELRFSNYFDETVSLESLYDFIPTNSFSRDNLNYESGSVKNIHYGDILTDFQTLFDVSKERVPYINESVDLKKYSDLNFCKPGDIIFADASEDYDGIGKHIEILSISGLNILAGLHTIHARLISDKVEIGFMAYQLQSWNVRFQIMRIAQGTKVFGISTKRLGKLSVNIPPKSEQQKIASFLSSIDKKIEITSTQLEKTREFKKGLLQQMFV